MSNLVLPWPILYTITKQQHYKNNTYEGEHEDEIMTMTDMNDSDSIQFRLFQDRDWSLDSDSEKIKMK